MYNLFFPPLQLMSSNSTTPLLISALSSLFLLMVIHSKSRTKTYFTPLEYPIFFLFLGLHQPPFS